MNEKQLQALIKKTTAKVAAAKKPTRPTYDAALDATKREQSVETAEATEIFEEMKKRSF